MKLKQPVGVARAFCCRGCHSSFYRKRCLVCEGEMVRRSENQLICGKRRCRNGLEASQNRTGYLGPSGVISPLINPHKMGTETMPRERPTSLFANAPLNILGGGSFRWPNTPRLEPGLLEKIRTREVGPHQINAPALIPESVEAALVEPAV